MTIPPERPKGRPRAGQRYDPVLDFAGLAMIAAAWLMCGLGGLGLLCTLIIHEWTMPTAFLLPGLVLMVAGRELVKRSRRRPRKTEDEPQ